MVQDLAEHTNTDNIQADVLVCNMPQGRRVSENISGISVIRTQTLLTFRSNPISFDFIKTAIQCFHQYDVIHLHEPFPLGSLICWMLPRKTKLVVTWHSDIVRQRFLKWMVLPFQWLTLLRADVIIATSKNMRENSFVRRFANKTKVIPLSIAEERLQENRDDEFFFLFAGRFVYYKGLQELLEAAKKVKVQLKLIGNGSLWKTVEQHVKDSQLNHVELIKGPVSDEVLRKYFSECSAFVFPSNADSEAFGLVQLEAMAAGKPVINTRLKTGVPEVSVDGETGITVNPNSPQELAQAMRQLHENPELRKRLGRNAQERVKKHFVHSVTIPKIEAIYQSLVK